MGRGLSNRTKVWKAANALAMRWEAEVYLPELAKDPEKPQRLKQKFQARTVKKLNRSNWLRNNIYKYFPSGQPELLHHQAADKKYNPAEILYNVVNYLVVYSNPRSHTDFKFKFLVTAPGDSDALLWRRKALLYLALVQHFMGREWAQKLKVHYKTYNVKYRKPRSDRGDKLTGDKLTEFKMKLEGHSLLVKPLGEQVLKQGDIEPG